MQVIDREGSFQVDIIDYGLNHKKETGTYSVFVKVRARTKWEPTTKTWDDWTAYEAEAAGFLNVVKRDHTLNDDQIRRLVEHAGWDGHWKSIQEHTWQPTPCQVSIKKKTYQGNETFDVDWINAFDDTPRSGMADADFQSLEQQFGAPCRALASSSKRNTTVPADKPADPPPAKTEGGDDIPF